MFNLYVQAPQQERLIWSYNVWRCPIKRTPNYGIYVCVCVCIYIDVYVYVLLTFNLGQNG